MDFDVLVVGAGPAGLTAANALARAGQRVLALDRETFGGRIMNVERLEDCPRAGERSSGAAFASALVEDAGRLGVTLELNEAVEVESYSDCLSLRCADGKAWTARAVLLAGGLRARALGIPGEARLQGKGMIHCALCDAGFYAGRTIAVCGGGDAGLIEALLLARQAAKVHVIEAASALSASADLQARARAEPKLAIRCGEKPLEVLGEAGVTGIRVARADGGAETLPVDGVLVHVGFDPDTDFLQSLLSLDEHGSVQTGARMETAVAGVFAAGDLRAGSPRRVAAALRDGEAAAAGLLAYLQARA